MCLYGLLQDSTVPQRREGEAAEATAAPAGRKTLEVVSGAERIADALALVAAEAERMQVRSLCKLPSATLEAEKALLSVPYSITMTH